MTQAFNLSQLANGVNTSGQLNAASFLYNQVPVANGGTGLATLTAGNIPYGAGTSAFGNSSNLFWDSSNIRLGIGTNTPAVKMSIVGTDAVLIPVGTTAQRPTGAAGYLRFNSTLSQAESYNGTSWLSLITGTNGIASEASGGTGTTTGYYGFKNRIINGAMVIDQRNAGASITPTNSQYSLDRWQGLLAQASKYTLQQSTTAPTGFINSLVATSSSAYTVVAGDYFDITQYIEGLNMADFAWGTASAATITISFWVRSSLTGTFGGSVQNNGQTRSYPFSYTISTANTFEQKTITIAGDTSGTWLTTNGRGIQFNFSLGTGSTYSGTAGTWATANYLGTTGAVSVVGTNAATFYITGVQLEKGSTATSFDYRPYGTELMLCQRYYETCFSLGTAPAGGIAGGRVRFLNMSNTQTNDVTNNILFSVSKRAIPTMTQYASTGNTVAASFDNFGTQGGNMFATLGANAISFSHWAAVAEL